MHRADSQLQSRSMKTRMLKFLDRLPPGILFVFALLLGLAPFVPEPHLVEKLRMLFQGTLTRTVDILDLLMHATPVLLLGLKLWRMAWLRKASERSH
jgi:hypothetical protein